jgi:hypothetical protein
MRRSAVGGKLALHESEEDVMNTVPLETSVLAETNVI